MIWELLGSFLLGLAVGYAVCSITVAVLTSLNIKEVSRNAIRESDEEKTRELVGQVLTGIVREKEKGDITVITLDMMNAEDEKVAEVTIRSESVAEDITVGRRYCGICT